MFQHLQTISFEDIRGPLTWSTLRTIGQLNINQN